MKLTPKQAIAGQVALAIQRIEAASAAVENGDLRSAADALSAASETLRLATVVEDISKGTLELVDSEEESEFTPELVMFPAYEAEFTRHDEEGWTRSSISPVELDIEESEFVLGAEFDDTQIPGYPYYAGQRMKFTPVDGGPSYIVAGNAHPATGSAATWTVTAILHPTQVLATFPEFSYEYNTPFDDDRFIPMDYRLEGETPAEAIANEDRPPKFDGQRVRVRDEAGNVDEFIGRSVESTEWELAEETEVPSGE